MMHVKSAQTVMFLPAHTQTANGQSLSMAAEVGRLTRNIRFEGAPYADMQSEAFGARIMVSRMVENGQLYIGTSLYTLCSVTSVDSNFIHNVLFVIEIKKKSFKETNIILGKNVILDITNLFMDFRVCTSL